MKALSFSLRLSILQQHELKQYAVRRVYSTIHAQRTKVRARSSSKQEHDGLLLNLPPRIGSYLKAKIQSRGCLDHSTFRKGLKHCIKCNDHDSIRTLMGLSHHSTLQKESIVTADEFTFLFAALSGKDSANHCYQYFKMMTGKFKINPTLTMFVHLMRSCRNPIKIPLMEEYRKIMEGTFGISPNHLIYTEMMMIYTNARQYDDAVRIFKEWLSKTMERERQKPEYSDILSAYLKVFSVKGDVDGMNTAIRLLRKYKHEITISMYSDLIKGCISARRPTKAMAYFNRMRRDGFVPDDVLFNLRAIALKDIIRTSPKSTFLRKKKLFNILMDSTQDLKIQWTAMIALYHDVDSTKIIEFFEDKMSDWLNAAFDKTAGRIDCRGLDHLQIQFLLRFIIGFKLQEIDFEAIHELKSLKIEIDSKMRCFVEKELQHFDPSIKCEIKEMIPMESPNKSLSDSISVHIPMNELSPYLQPTTPEEPNHAQKRLTQPSDDWYLDDPIPSEQDQSVMEGNTMMIAHSEIDQLHRDQSKRIRKNPETLTRIKPTDTTNQRIRNKLNHAKSTPQILDILTQNDNHIIDESVYAKALQQCIKLRNHSHLVINQIMERLLLNSKVTPTIVVFNVFFNAMSHCDEPLQCRKYVDIVLNEVHSNSIIPDQVTFPTLIKSCRKQSMYQLAEHYLNIMRTTFNRQPCLLTYTEMLTVYAKSFQKEKAIKLFNEYRNRKDLLPHDATYGAYLNVFSRCGDVNGMESVITLIKKTDISFLNPIVYSDIMRTYIVAGLPRRCISMYRELMKEKMVEIQSSHLSLGCIAMSHLCHCHTVKMEEKKVFYAEINDILDGKFVEYGFKVSSVEIKPLFEACIGVYGKDDVMEVVRVFEELVSKALMGYMKWDALYGDYALDLHGFHPSTAQFVLRYVFGMKLKEILKMMDDRNDLVIIVGKGKHSGKEGGMLKDFISKELRSFDPPIICDKRARDAGCILIEKSKLKPFLADNAADSLLLSFKDWYLKEVVDEDDSDVTDSKNLFQV